MEYKTDDDCIIIMSFTKNYTCGISLQHSLSGSVGISSYLAQIHLHQERVLKCDIIAGKVYMNVVLLLQTHVWYVTCRCASITDKRHYRPQVFLVVYESSTEKTQDKNRHKDKIKPVCNV